MAERKRIKTISQFGLERTGTNLFKHLMELNFHVQVNTNTKGWKHGVCDPRYEDADFLVFSTKDIYAWLDSLYRFRVEEGRWITPPSFYEFLTRFERKKMPPVPLWNAMNGAWYDIHAMLQVPYEKIWDAKTSEETLCKLNERVWGLTRKSSEWLYPRKKLGAGDVDTFEEGGEFDANYYKNELYFPIEAKAAELIEYQVDPELRRKLYP